MDLYTVKGKDVEQLNSMLPFVEAFIDRAMDGRHFRSMINVHTNLFELWYLLNCKSVKQVQALQPSNIKPRHTQQLKALLKDTIYVDCETSLYTVKFHLFGNVVEELDHSRSSELLSTSA